MNGCVPQPEVVSFCRKERRRGGGKEGRKEGEKEGRKERKEGRKKQITSSGAAEAST